MKSFRLKKRNHTKRRNNTKRRNHTKRRNNTKRRNHTKRRRRSGGGENEQFEYIKNVENVENVENVNSSSGTEDRFDALSKLLTEYGNNNSDTGITHQFQSGERRKLQNQILPIFETIDLSTLSQDQTKELLNGVVKTNEAIVKAYARAYKRQNDQNLIPRELIIEKKNELGDMNEVVDINDNYLTPEKRQAFMIRAIMDNLDIMEYNVT
jgi:hypothetical protein